MQSVLTPYAADASPRPSRFPGSIESRVRLSIVIPVYNGATTIETLTDAVVSANPGYRLQVVLVNDASFDASRAICTGIARRHSGTVTFVDLARNVGEHNAVMAGLAHATGDFCVIMDDDFQNPPAEAYRLADEAVRSGRDIVFAAYPVKRHHWARNLGSRLVNAAARRLMKLPDGLYLSSFKCLSRFAVNHVTAYRGPFPYVDGLALRVTRNIGVITTTHAPTRKDRSGYTASKLLRLWATMSVNFSVVPLRVSTLLGVFFSLLGIAGAVYATVEKLQNPGLPIGWPSLIVAITLFSGVQLLILGVVGEYLGQLVLTVNGTPQYVVRQVVEGTDGK
ncbi:MAG TPA: glycosyltransferase family 2 protein [Candidatus Deferrimicrobiaceae bacterium]|jgi:undecaprenyl-phosphate 4-deoxy-4-formamido-L-arabinose transferase